MLSKFQTKHALIVSVLTLLLCVAMLIGATFAWFTDSVTSGKNAIIAGNLDVELEYTTDFVSWQSVGGETTLFEEDTLWEPGHAEVVYLRVRNAGTLALKYRFAVDVVCETASKNVAGKDFLLSDYLQYGVVEGQQSLFASRDQAITAVQSPSKLADSYRHAVLSADDEPVYLALVVFMPQTVGNEANYRGAKIPKIELGVSVTATQAVEEHDSFGTTYDETSVFVVSTPQEFNDAVVSAPTNSVIAFQNNIDLTSVYSYFSIWEKSFLIDLRGHTLTTNLLQLMSLGGADMNIVIQNGTLKGGNSTALLDIYSDGSDQITLHNLSIIADDAADTALTMYGFSSTLTMDNVNITGAVNLTDCGFTEITGGTFTARERDAYVIHFNHNAQINGGTFIAEEADQYIFDIATNQTSTLLINDGTYRYGGEAPFVVTNGRPDGRVIINDGIFNGTPYEPGLYDSLIDN